MHEICICLVYIALTHYVWLDFGAFTVIIILYKKQIYISFWKKSSRFVNPIDKINLIFTKIHHH